MLKIVGMLKPNYHLDGSKLWDVLIDLHTILLNIQTDLEQNYWLRENSKRPAKKSKLI